MENLSNLLLPIKVKISALLFDPYNPRLLDINDSEPNCPEDRFDSPKVQQRLEQELDGNEYDVQTLAENIRQIGFLSTDRIIVRKWKGPSERGEKYVVIEGNRRTRALKLIIQENIEGINVVSDELLKQIEEIEALVIIEEGTGAERFSLAVKILQGVRHLSGIKAWGPYQQARIIYQLREQGQSASNAAAQMGISAKSANSLWRSYMALEQMKGEEDFSEKVTSDMFSFFQEALKSVDVKEWLKWSDENKGFENKSNLQSFYELISENDQGIKKLPMAIDVRKLSKIIGNRDALMLLKSETGNLDTATRMVDSETFHREFQPAVNHCNSVIKSLPTESVRSMSDEHKAMLRDLIASSQRALDDNLRLNKE